MSEPDPSEWSRLTLEEKKQLHLARLGAQAATDNASQAKHTQAIRAIIPILGDVTEGCIDTVRAERIATLAVDLALRNIEGK